MSDIKIQEKSSSILIQEFQAALNERHQYTLGRESIMMEYSHQEGDLDAQIAALQKQKKEILEKKKATDKQYEDAFKSQNLKIQNLKHQCSQAAYNEMTFHLEHLQVTRPVSYINSGGFEIPFITAPSPLPSFK